MKKYYIFNKTRAPKHNLLNVVKYFYNKRSSPQLKNYMFFLFLLDNIEIPIFNTLNILNNTVIIFLFISFNITVDINLYYFRFALNIFIQLLNLKLMQVSIP